MKDSILATFNRDEYKYFKHFWQAKQAYYFYLLLLCATLFIFEANIIISSFLHFWGGREYLYFIYIYVFC